MMDKKLLLEKFNTSVGELVINIKNFLRTMDKSDPDYTKIKGLYDYILQHDLQTEGKKSGPVLIEGKGRSPMLKAILESKSVDWLKNKLSEAHDYYNLGKWTDLTYEERSALTDLLDSIYGEAYLPYKGQSGGFAELKVHNITPDKIEVLLTSGVMPQGEDDPDPTKEYVIIDRKSMKVTEVEPYLDDGE